MRRLVVLGFIGTQLDSGKGAGRWQKWRTTVSLVQREDVLVHRIELLHTGRHDALIAQVSADIRSVSPDTQVNAVKLAIDDPWDFEQVYGALHDFARGYQFKPEQEDYWVHITTGTHVAQICLFLMTEARYFPGVLLQTSPPRRQVAGVTGTHTLIDLDLSKYDRIAQRFEREQADAVAFLKSGIATRNKQFNRVIDEIERVAIRSHAPILLMGPTGAGKSLLARRIYELKKSRHQVTGEFVELNCATLRGDAAGSALFGHVKGAFTGASGDRAGLLRTANKGLLFLDEIGELGVDEQAMLLKAVEEKRFFPLGGDKEVRSDFQLIAGTNRDLRMEVARGAFREDLFARINLWTYQLPGLAQRSEDLEPNLDYLLAQLSAETGRMARFNREAKQKYLRFAASPAAKWAGNFRDLSASAMRMNTLAEGGRINDEVVDGEIVRLQQLWRTPATESALAALVGAAAVERLDLFDQLQLEAVLRVCARCATLSEAGRRLFAVSRASKASSNDADRLRKYLARFGLSWEEVGARRPLPPPVAS